MVFNTEIEVDIDMFIVIEQVLLDVKNFLDWMVRTKKLFLVGN